MNDVSLTRKHYSRGVMHGDIINATKEKPIKITRYEFVTRRFDAYLDDEGRFCENFVAEHPQSENIITNQTK